MMMMFLMTVMMMMIMAGVGEAELNLARSDLADFLHARALSHCQLAISSFTRYILCRSALVFNWSVFTTIT